MPNPHYSIRAYPLVELQLELEELRMAAFRSTNYRLGVPMGEFPNRHSHSPAIAFLEDGFRVDLSDSLPGMFSWEIDRRGFFHANYDFFELWHLDHKVNGLSRILCTFDSLEYVTRLYNNLLGDDQHVIAFQIGFHTIADTQLSKEEIRFTILEDRVCRVDELLIPAEHPMEITLREFSQSIYVLGKSIMDKFFWLYGGLQVPESTYRQIYDFYYSSKVDIF